VAAAQHPARDRADRNNPRDERIELRARAERDDLQRLGDLRSGSIDGRDAEHRSRAHSPIQIGERGWPPARACQRKRGGDGALAGAALAGYEQYSRQRIG